MIRKMIEGHLTQLGGFSCQRLLDDFGKTVGFRITPVAEAMDLTAKYSPELSDIFLYFDGEKTIMAPEVFTDTAIKYLRESEGKKLILLDEIGGVELMSPEFRETLCQVLEGDIPCIGVLKLEISIRHMCDNITINHECIEHHLKLRTDLMNRYDAEIFRFERKSADKAKKAMEAFLDFALIE